MFCEAEIWDLRKQSIDYQLLSVSSRHWLVFCRLVTTSVYIIINMKIAFLCWLIFQVMKILWTSSRDVLQNSLIAWDTPMLPIAWNFVDQFYAMRIHGRSIGLLSLCLFLIRLRWRWMLREWKRMFFLFWFNIPHLHRSNFPPLLLISSCIIKVTIFNQPSWESFFRW